MSEFAFRFSSNKMLTNEEEEHKEEIVQLTEDILQAKGIQCDASMSKVPEGELREILERVRGFYVEQIFVDRIIGGASNILR